MILDSNCASNGSLVTGSTSWAFCSDERLSLLGNPDVILFYGGTNDIVCKIPIGEFNYDGDYSERGTYFKQAYAYCLYKMKTLYPKAKIVCVLIPDYSGNNNKGSESTYPLQNLDNHPTREYNTAIRELANSFNCAICNIGPSIPYFNRQDYYILDGDGSLCHPKKHGMQIIYKMIRSILVNMF